MRLPTDLFLFALASGFAACSREGADPRRSAAASSARIEPAPGTPPSPLHGDGSARAASADSGAPGSIRKPPPDLDVVLITVDSLRADMPWAGYPRPIAPRLTELAARAVIFRRAYSIASYTSTSVAGLLGGKYPSEMKRDGFFFGTYPKEDLMFPEVLQAAKIHTLGAQAHGYFRDASFQQGFDRWELVPNLKWSNTTDENITAPQQEALAEKLLSEKACDEGRFFAWFHFMDPHDRYQVHEDVPSFGKGARDRYDGEVAFTDRSIGKLLDFIAGRPWGERTAIIVSADHGEAFGEHGQFSHGFELWENLVRVPLLVVVPGAAPRAIDARRSAIDLAPTILDLFGLPPEPSFEGKSLVPELYGAPAEERDVVLDLPMTSDSDRRRALIHGKDKLVAAGNDASFRLFDLDADPGELNGVTRGEVFADMRARYAALSRSLKEVPPYSCRESCLNGAYAKKDGGAP